MQKVKKDSIKKKDIIISAAKKKGYSYVSSSFSWIWDVKFNYKTMFELQKMNAQATAAKDLIVRMIGRKWLLFRKKDVLLRDFDWGTKVNNLFLDPTTNSRKNFKDKYFTNAFCSWMINAFYAKMGDWNRRVQILDSRKIERKTDAYWNIKEVKYDAKEVALKDYTCQIVRYDPDNSSMWMSMYNPVVYDALSDREASEKNYMFFKWNAMPSVILTMSDDIENEDEVNAAIDQFEHKYKGTDKSHGVLALWWIKEIRTLDVSNRDLELLDLKKFSIKVFGMLFKFDPRFLSFRDWENWSHSEYAMLAIQSDKSMQSYADDLEEFMYNIIIDIYPEFPYEWVELINDTFLDEETKVKIFKDQIQNWIATPAQIIEQMWLPTDNLSENMYKHYMNIQYNTIDWLVDESRSRTDLNIKRSKE